jgi:hypothetical protein
MRRPSHIALLAFAVAATTASPAAAQYCGDEGWSALEEAAELAAEEEWESAREELVSALRLGEIRPWERATALVLLAEAQLRTGEYRPASINYRRAIDLGGEDVAPEVRVGLALALAGSRRDDEAFEEAAGFVSSVGCDADARAHATACYGAYLVESKTAPRETVRLDALRRAEQLRSDAGNDASLRTFDALLRIARALSPGASPKPEAGE